MGSLSITDSRPQMVFFFFLKTSGRRPFRIYRHTYHFFFGGWKNQRKRKKKILRRITNYNTTGIRIALDGRLSSLVPRENQGGDSIVVLAFSLLLSMHFISREREKKGGEMTSKRNKLRRRRRRTDKYTQGRGYYGIHIVQSASRSIRLIFPM